MANNAKRPNSATTTHAGVIHNKRESSRLTFLTTELRLWTRTQFGRRSFHVAAPVVWNSLPARLHSASISCG